MSAQNPLDITGRQETRLMNSFRKIDIRIGQFKFMARYTDPDDTDELEHCHPSTFLLEVTSPGDPTLSQKYYTLMNWNRNLANMVFTSGHTLRNHIRSYAKASQLLLMGIGEDFLRGHIANRSYTPLTCNERHEENHPSYFSNRYAITDYVRLIRFVYMKVTDTQTAEIILLAVTVDFAHYAAQCLGLHLPTISFRWVAFARKEIKEYINNVDDHYFCKKGFKDIFKAILRQTKPSPTPLEQKNKSVLYNAYIYFFPGPIYPLANDEASDIYDSDNSSGEDSNNASVPSDNDASQAAEQSSSSSSTGTGTNVHPADTSPPQVTNAFSESPSLSFLGTTPHSFSSVHTLSRLIIDTGASVCATSSTTQLSNIQQCEPITAYPAFGPPLTPTQRGEFGPLGLETLIIPGMPDTLISVSQLCNGGISGVQHVAVFTTEGVRAFTFDSIREALQLMDQSGQEVLRGFISDGIYVSSTTPTTPSGHSTFNMAQFKPPSPYDHLHMVTGHPGIKGMLWHRANSTNGEYTDKDASTMRPQCEGCLYGGMRQHDTDPHRTHRPKPSLAGQCFAVDAYTHAKKSTKGSRYADLFIDLATRRIHPVFTSSRTAEELCIKAQILFASNPTWKRKDANNTHRYFRLDAEHNYRSIQFLEFAARWDYELERTPVRDKHAGGIAERSVGIIALKTNVAMLAPTPAVPDSYWEYAMKYACDTHSFNYSSSIGTSPYTFITGQPVNIKYLQPFWARCWVFIPLESRKGKVGQKRAYKAHMVGYSFSSILIPNYLVVPFINGRYSGVKESKDVIFDNSINFNIYKDNEEPSDETFHPHLTDSSPSFDLLPVPDDIVVREYADDYVPPTAPSGNVIYWQYLHAATSILADHSHHFSSIITPRDPRVPRNFDQAMRSTEWAGAIDKELKKFEDNVCLQIVPYIGQSLVPMMWLFSIKTDGTQKARLVGRGDLMKPYVDFDPNAVYCGNVTACSIKLAITIAAKYRLVMRGGDLEGAYLVTRANADYPVHIKTPQGY